MKISVIMPTLNSAEHITDSLDSLAGQTFKDFEVIAVDSASKDDTVNILSLYEKKTRLKIISAPGLSPALARNIGLKHAQSDYIAFCDSDDVMKPVMLETLYETARTHDADITVCDFDMVYPGRTVENFGRVENANFTLQNGNITDYYYKFCAAPKPNNYVWSRLYRQKFLNANAVLFSDTRYSEDHLFNLSALLASPRVAHIGKSLYRYLQYDDSAMRKHVKQTNHGALFLNSFKCAARILADKDLSVSEPILAIYAYTRVKSILFYAWQAGLSKTSVTDAVSVFTSDVWAKHFLSFCLERDYIGDFCRLHSFSAEKTNTVRAMILSCINGADLPDMSEAFS